MPGGELARCRTVGSGRVVDEMIMVFTHDVPVQAFLPNVPPTGRRVRLPVVVVMGANTLLQR